jgi:hypothetical protein
LIFIAEGKRQALWVVSVDGTGKISRIDILTVAPKPAYLVEFPLDRFRQSDSVAIKPRLE